MARRIPRDVRSAAALLGQRGGSVTSPEKAAAARRNAQIPRKPCACGHGRSRHRWQRDGSRAGCKDCPCQVYVHQPRSGIRQIV